MVAEFDSDNFMGGSLKMSFWGLFQHPVRHEFQRLKSHSKLPPTSLFLLTIQPEGLFAKSPSVYHRTIAFHHDRGRIVLPFHRGAVNSVVRATLRRGVIKRITRIQIF